MRNPKSKYRNPKEILQDGFVIPAYRQAGANHENLSLRPPSDGGGIRWGWPGCVPPHPHPPPQGEREMNEQNLLIFFQNGFNLIRVDFSKIFFIDHHHRS